MKHDPICFVGATMVASSHLAVATSAKPPVTGTNVGWRKEMESVLCRLTPQTWRSVGDNLPDMSEDDEDEDKGRQLLFVSFLIDNTPRLPQI